LLLRKLQPLPALAASPPADPGLKGCAGLSRIPGYANIIKIASCPLERSLMGIL